MEGGQPLVMNVPCGKCAVCQKNKRLLWHFRTFHEVIACINSLGFVLYDTLTYADEHLPKLSHFLDLTDTGIKDFSCFNHKHFKDFLKRLRRRLDYNYKGVTFKYFLTSEYGSDDRFTHRPHYHILFFVYKNGVPFSSRIMSKLVSECWSYGRTDGLPYKPVSYVLNNTFCKTPYIDNKPYLRVCNYVSKYITKDSDFQDEINKRLKLIEDKVEDIAKQKELIRNIGMFHRQSHGYGLSYLENIKDDELRFIYENGACRIIDDKKVKVTIPLPLYYKRKLYYTCVKVDGKYKWIPTPKGLYYIENRYLKNIAKTTDSLFDTINNMPQAIQDVITRLLNNRSIQDLAIYNLYYKNYSCNMIEFTEFFHKKIDLEDNEYNLYDWLMRIIDNKRIVHINEHTYLIRDKERKTINITNHDTLFSLTSKSYDYDTFRKQITFNEHSSPLFHNFDRINALIDDYNLLLGKSKQRLFEQEELLKKRYKYLFKYGKIS